jgi:uncharacterized RmlC-like cupin family protein
MSASLQPTCHVVHPSQSYEGKQGHTFLTGISSESVGAQKLCMHLLTISPGGRGHAHMHKDHETAIYILSGDAEVWYGERLQEHLEIERGDFLYIPAGVPHLPINRSQTVPCCALVARTDPNEQESVVLLPALEQYVPGRES